jgi:hypothetical protein
LCGASRSGDARNDFTPGDRKHYRRAEPGTVPHELAPGHACRIVLNAHFVTTTVPVMNGWIEQM